MQLTNIIGLALSLSSVFLAATPVAGAPTIDPHKTVPTHSITPDGTCGPMALLPNIAATAATNNTGVRHPDADAPSHPVSPDGSCGPGSAGPYRCADGNCCSSFGWW
ncbi:hypothetical protein PG987_013861 [Apiospora arundinis]